MASRSLARSEPDSLPGGVRGGLRAEVPGTRLPPPDRARAVLAALLRAAREAGVDVRNPRRVARVERVDGGYRVAGDWGALATNTLVLATGGKSYPKTG